MPWLSQKYNIILDSIQQLLTNVSLYAILCRYDEKRLICRVSRVGRVSRRQPNLTIQTNISSGEREKRLQIEDFRLRIAWINLKSKIWNLKSKHAFSPKEGFFYAELVEALLRQTRWHGERSSRKIRRAGSRDTRPKWDKVISMPNTWPTSKPISPDLSE